MKLSSVNSVNVNTQNQNRPQNFGAVRISLPDVNQLKLPGDLDLPGSIRHYLKTLSSDGTIPQPAFQRLMGALGEDDVVLLDFEKLHLLEEGENLAQALGAKIKHAKSLVLKKVLPDNGSVIGALTARLFPNNTTTVPTTTNHSRLIAAKLGLRNVLIKTANEGNPRVTQSAVKNYLDSITVKPQLPREEFASRKTMRGMAVVPPQQEA